MFSPSFMDVLFISLIIGVFLILIFCYVVFFRGKKTLFTNKEVSDIRSRFADLQKRANWDPRFVVLEGDKLLQLLLRKRGYSGDLGTMLKSAGKLFDNTQALWDAHKLRNRVAHELDVKIEPLQAKHSLAAYRQAFRNLGVDM